MLTQKSRCATVFRFAKTSRSVAFAQQMTEGEKTMAKGIIVGNGPFAVPPFFLCALGCVGVCRAGACSRRVPVVSQRVIQRNDTEAFPMTGIFLLNRSVTVSLSPDTPTPRSRVISPSDAALPRHLPPQREVSFIRALFDRPFLARVCR